MYLCERPDLKCDFSPNKTPRDGNCLLHGIQKLLYKVCYKLLFLAIVDGILYNDAFKHNQSDN